MLKGKANTADELSNKLTGIAFGQALAEAKILPMLVGQIQRLRWGSETA